jgi:hypothetical protein
MRVTSRVAALFAVAGAGSGVIRRSEESGAQVPITCPQLLISMRLD